MGFHDTISFRSISDRIENNQQNIASDPSENKSCYSHLYAVIGNWWSEIASDIFSPTEKKGKISLCRLLRIFFVLFDAREKGLDLSDTTPQTDYSVVAVDDIISGEKKFLYFVLLYLAARNKRERKQILDFHCNCYFTLDEVRYGKRVEDVR